MPLEHREAPAAHGRRTPVLLTIERGRVDEGLRRSLESAGVSPIYCPLRELRPVEPDAAGTAAILAADVVVITSGFALHVYLGHPQWRRAHGGGAPATDPAPAPRRDGSTASNDAQSAQDTAPDQETPTLIVVSGRMAAKARAAGVRRVLVPREENQHGIAALLATLRYARAVHLCGSLSTPRSALPADVERVRVYENHWDADCEDRAHARIAEAFEAAEASSPQTGRQAERHEQAGGERDVTPIDRILVTSPSAYRRLLPIIGRMPQCFTARPTYYTLGPSTTDVVEVNGDQAVPPDSPTDVLRSAITRLLAD